jgi:hypothetical protein
MFESEPPRKSGSQNLNGLAQKQIASEKAKFDDFEKISPVLTSSLLISTSLLWTVDDDPLM